MSQSLSNAFQQKYEASNILRYAAENPPPPWLRVFVAASLAQSIALNNGKTGENLHKIGAVDLNLVSAELDESCFFLCTKSSWDRPDDARESLKILDNYFLQAEKIIQLSADSRLTKEQTNARQTAKVGRAFIAGMDDAPDTPLADKPLPFQQNTYHPNPFTAINVAAEMIFHGHALARRREAQPQPFRNDHDPFSRPEYFLHEIRRQGYLGLLPQNTTAETLSSCCYGLRSIRDGVDKLITGIRDQNIPYPSHDAFFVFDVVKNYTDAFAPPKDIVRPALAPNNPESQIISVRDDRWGQKRGLRP